MITITGQGSIAYLVRSGLLDKLKIFCDPVIVMLWSQADLIKELETKGFQVHILPQYKVSAEYNLLRYKIDIWYKHFVLKTPSTRIALRLHNRYRSKKLVRKRLIKDYIVRLRFELDNNYINKLIRLEAKKIVQQSSYDAFVHFINSIDVEAMLTVTPFLHEIELLARILKNKNGLNIAAVHSFDNITKRGWPAIFFDEYLVWNNYNRNELERLMSISLNKDNISVTGAPQFDAHYNNTLHWSKEQWLKELGLPHEKKIILYAGGSENLFPDEPQYLLHIADAVKNGLFGKNVIILFRCHPLDKPGRWKDFVGEPDYLFYDSKPASQAKIDYNNFTQYDLEKLIATLKFTDVHVNLCSTMAIDGAVFKKPIIGPYYDEKVKANQNAIRNIYHQEHYKPVLSSGAVQLAQNSKDLVEKIKNALDNPEENSKCSDVLIESIITYKDGHSAQRVADKMKFILE